MILKGKFRDSWGRRRDLFYVAGLCFLCVVVGVLVGARVASSIAYAGDRVSTVGEVEKIHKLPDVGGKGRRAWIEGTKGWDENGNYLYPVESSDSVGIGVTPTAKLDIDGLVKIRGGTPGSNKVLTSDVNGLASWEKPSTSDPDAWKIIGNAGTTAGTNFIGTTDNQAFDIRTNNTLRTRITTKGQIETYNTGYSVFIGEQAGANDDLSDNYNVFVGRMAGNANTTGYGNTATGYQALYSNTQGSHSTAVGYQSLYHNTTGWMMSGFNTAVGSYALYSNTSASSNTAVGSHALYSNTGSGNTAVGAGALRYNTTGTGNTAVGAVSLYSFSFTGTFNTAVGDFAGSNITTGDYNTCIGGNSGSVGDRDHTIAVGYNASPTASYYAVIGNSSMLRIGGYQNWYNYSDKRFEKDIKENVPGLAFITKLRPITYHFDMDKLETFFNTPDSLRNRRGEAQKERITYTGFIAQEVEEAANEVGFDFSGVSKPQNNKDHYALSYAEFVVPLVKAVQEQQEMIEQLQKQIDELKRR
jgi:hypothetical protein